MYLQQVVLVPMYHIREFEENSKTFQLSKITLQDNQVTHFTSSERC
jgi:hypothetical protein